MPFLSIIIPVYNAEKYLQACFDSIKRQSFTDYEVIIIDDGATDNSPNICDKYAESDDRVKVYHLPNGGASRARNIGFDKANGKYVYCIDNDDCFYDEEYFTKIYDSLSKNEVDILQTGATYVSDEPNAKETVVDYSDVSDFSSDEVEIAIDWLVKNNKYETSCWTKIIKTDFLRENKLYFDESLVVEDFDWNMRFLQCVKSYGILKSASYIHIYRQGSITAAKGAKRHKNCVDQIETIKKYADLFQTEGFSTQLNKSLLSFLTYQYYITIGLASTLDKEYKKDIKNSLKQIKFIVEFSSGKQQKLLKLIYNLFGFNALTFVLSYYYNHFRKRCKKQ